MQRINLKRIVNPADEDYFSEICVYICNNPLGKNNIPANLRCRMNFSCKIDPMNEDGITYNRNISIVIPSAKEMIEMISKTGQFTGDVVTPDFWKALVYYCQVFLGTMRNSPLQFCLSNADSTSRLFDRFEDVIDSVIAEPWRARVNLTSYIRTTDIYAPERCIHLALTQETGIGANIGSIWWSSEIIAGETNVAGILPLPAFINQGVPQSPAQQFDKQGMMLFFEESSTLTQDTAFITGFLTSCLPHRAVKWQKEDSMTPEIINPNLERNGIREGDLLDQSTIN